MPRITITICDVASPGAGRMPTIVQTDSERPAIGRQVTEAQALATDLLRMCERQAGRVEYGVSADPLVALARDLLDPERYGHAVTAEIRAAARRALGGVQ